MKILIADLDYGVIENVSSVINKYKPDWHISIVGSGEKCIDTVKDENQYDILILGTTLPDMSGFELIWHIRDDSDIPILLLSRNKDMKMLVKAFNGGANEYMTSPINKDIFIARLKALVRRRTWDIKTKENNLKDRHRQYTAK
jgi:DNA-binding response OmpR family regulator